MTVPQGGGEQEAQEGRIKRDTVDAETLPPVSKQDKHAKTQTCKVWSGAVCLNPVPHAPLSCLSGIPAIHTTNYLVCSANQKLEGQGQLENELDSGPLGPGLRTAGLEAQNIINDRPDGTSCAPELFLHFLIL